MNTYWEMYFDTFWCFDTFLLKCLVTLSTLYSEDGRSCRTVLDVFIPDKVDEMLHLVNWQKPLVENTAGGLPTTFLHSNVAPIFLKNVGPISNGKLPSS